MSESVVGLGPCLITRAWGGAPVVRSFAWFRWVCPAGCSPGCSCTVGEVGRAVPPSNPSGRGCPAFLPPPAPSLFAPPPPAPPLLPLLSAGFLRSPSGRRWFLSR